MENSRLNVLDLFAEKRVDSRLEDQDRKVNRYLGKPKVSLGLNKNGKPRWERVTTVTDTACASST